MDVVTRMKKIRILEKIENNPVYSKKIGIYDVSFFVQDNKKKTEKEN